MENQRYIDELDLKSCIKIIVKKKTLILTTSLLSVLILATPALFEPKIYSATASITITPHNITHKIRLKSNLILTRIIQNLNLKNSSGKELSADELSEKLTTRNAGEDNLTYLDATADNPEKAKEIADTWVQEYLKHIQELNAQQVAITEGSIAKQLELAQAKLNQAHEDVLNFKKTHRVDLLRTELLARETALDGIKKQLAQMQFDVTLKEIMLAELKNQMASKDKRNATYPDLEKLIVENTIEINTFPSKAEYLKKTIETMTKENTQLNNELIDKELEITKLTHDVDVRQNEYHTVSDKMNTTRNDLALVLGEIKIISTAISPTQPVNHGKINKTIALTSVLGLMLGIFIAFCIEFWQKGKKE